MTNILKDLELLVEDTNKKSSGSVKSNRHTDVFRLGQEIKITDSGFIYNKKTKTGRVMPVSVINFKGVILDSVFRFELWGKKSDGKPDFKDSTVSHSQPDGSKGNGTWPFPISTANIIKHYNPLCKSGLTLEEALTTYTNEEGRSEMSQRGMIYIMVTAMDTGELDPKTEEPVGLKAVEPFLAYISLSGVYTQMSFQRFVAEVAKAPEPLNDFKRTFAIFDTDKHPKAPGKKVIKLAAVGRLDNNEVQKGTALLETALTEAKAEQQKRLDEWKAKREASSPSL